MKITIVAKDIESPLVAFLINHLSNAEWISCESVTLDQAMEGKGSFFVTVLEDMVFEEIAELCHLYRQNCLRTIYVGYWDNCLIIGPSHFPGTTAGADSSLFFLMEYKLSRPPGRTELCELKTHRVEPLYITSNLDLFYSALSSLLNELKAVNSNQTNQRLDFVDSVALYSRGQMNEIRSEKKYVFPLFEDYMSDGTSFDNLNYSVLVRKFQHSYIHMENKFFSCAYTEGEQLGIGYNNVAIIGGGTAGYLTALFLKKNFPNLPVTLIESSKIPIIGVGEATTPEIRKFLFEELEFSALDFYKNVKPTWKLGIKFFWGQPGDYFFNYPFGKSDIRSAYLLNHDINCSSLTSILMANDSSFVVSTNGNGMGEFSSLSNEISYALHLDNALFVNYLRTKAVGAGVNCIDDVITDAIKLPYDGGIESVVGETGNLYSFDFFVDCTGFKSLLLEKTLKSSYVPYSKSLYTDSAVTGVVPNFGKVKPYTYAESMDNGWCWNIPMRNEDHRGYVFSSDHCTADQALEELKKKNPGIDDFKLVEFRSGRHDEICIGNVFAVGNSFAFVEPLESTGIHMIVKEIEVLTRNFRELKNSRSVRSTINRHINGHWDYLKDFLSIHYKFNNKLQTNFWKDCRETTDISAVQWLVDLYNEVGFLSYADENLKRIISMEVKDDIFGLSGFDTLLLGQGVVPKNLNGRLQNQSLWNSNVRTWKSIQRLTVPLEKDLSILTQYPELI